MKASERYYYLKTNGLCVNCGEVAQKGKTRCIRCAQIDAAKQHIREQEYSKERKAERRAYCRTWIKNHPDKNREYQRRYRNT